MHILSDASGSWVCGTIWALAWIQKQWPPDWQEVNIATKELVLIVAGKAL